MKRFAAYALLLFFAVAVAVVDVSFLSSRLSRLLLFKSHREEGRRNDVDPSGQGRELLLAPSFDGNGMSNQQNCLQIAANLAIQYNRTLLVPEVGYQGGGKSKHQARNIAFHDLFDEKASSERISYRIYRSDSNKKTQCWTTITIGTTAPIDPHPSEHCIQFTCSNGVVHRETPPDLFPHADRVYFPCSRFFVDLAADVINAMWEAAAPQKASAEDDGNNAEDGSTPLKLLTMHVRRGDREGWPLLNCSDVAVHYPNRVQVYGKRAVFCSSATHKVPLSWARFFQHLAGELPCDSRASSLLVCAKRFDAIFIATNDPQWVQDEVGPLRPKLPPVFVSGDFPFVKEKVLSRMTNRDVARGKMTISDETVELLVVDELIMARGDVYVPSFPSSITEQTLRLRMEEHVNDRDRYLYGVYDEYKNLQRAHRLQRQEKTMQKDLISAGRRPSKIVDANHNETFLSIEIVSDGHSLEKETVLLPVPKFSASCKPTALASYPGSGSTIVRLLIEMATGVWTGSIYRDLSLYNGSPHAFQGEGSLHDVVVVKTHLANKLLRPKRRIRRRGVAPLEAERTVLIVRNPEEAIPSKFNFVHSKKSDQQHQIQAPKVAWEDWRESHFTEELTLWSDHLQYWADNFPRPEQLFIVRFESLVSNETGPTALSDLTSFLGFPSTDASVTWKAVMQVLSKGIYRPKSYKPQLTPTLRAKTLETSTELIRKYSKSSPTIANILNTYKL